MPSLNLARIGALVAVGVLVLALAPAGCVGGWTYQNVPEGDRCNPYDSHGECASGLTCTVSAWQVANQSGTNYQGTPNLALSTGAGIDNAGNFNVLPFCPENYCCPVDGNGDIATSSNPNCQPGCNGGAVSICNSIGDTTPPYVGVCDFVDSGILPSADGGPGEAGTPDAAPDAESTPDAAPDAESAPSDGGDGG